jgi:hypothetical protein
VNTGGGPSSRNDYRTTKSISTTWLENTNEFVVTVTDGPSKHSLREDGTILALAERPNLSGAASIGIEARVPVVPFSSWVPEEHARDLFCSKGVLADLKYLERHKRLPYLCEFSEPAGPLDFGSRREFRDEIRARQLRSYQRLEKDGRAYVQ